jgi:membrane protein implicated in regulation of membrane protease activity
MNYYGVEWMPGLALVGMVVLLCLPYLALFWLLVLLVAVAVAFVVLARVAIAAPHVLARSIRRRRQTRAGARQRAAGLGGWELQPKPNEEM